MSRYSLEEFIAAARQQDRGQGLFELESPRLLEVNLNGEVWTKTGSMVAYVGSIKFERERLLEKGFGRLLKKAVSGEGAAHQGHRPGAVVPGRHGKKDTAA